MSYMENTIPSVSKIGDESLSIPCPSGITMEAFIQTYAENTNPSCITVTKHFIT